VFLLTVDCGQWSLLYCLLYFCRYVSMQCGCAPARNNTHASWRMLPCVGFTSRAVCLQDCNFLITLNNTSSCWWCSSSSSYSVVYFTCNRWWGRYKSSGNRIKFSTLLPEGGRPSRRFFSLTGSGSISSVWHVSFWAMLRCRHGHAATDWLGAVGGKWQLCVGKFQCDRFWNFCSTDWLTNWPTKWSSKWLTEWRTNSLNWQLSDWGNNQLTSQLTTWLTN